MKQIVLIVLLLGCFRASSQKNIKNFLKEKHVDSIDIKIDSILLIGIGSTVTRIFLDELSQTLMKRFEENSIVANYRYLGKNTTEAKSEFDTINKIGYKAILFFLPKDSSFYDVQGDMNQRIINTGMGMLRTVTPSSSIQYEQNFNFQLHIPGASMKKVWIAKLGVSGDLSNPKIAKKVAASLLSFFRKNKYIN